MDSQTPNDPQSTPETQDDSLDDSLRHVDSFTDVEDLTARFSQQQVMISHLKEMVMAEETARNEKIATTRQKMEKYTSQLAKIRDRARTTKQSKKSSDTVVDSPSPSKSQQSSSQVSSPVVSPPILADSPVMPISNVAIETSTDNKTPKSKMSIRETSKMLHQQIKERKAMIAERTKNEKELEKALIKIQKQLEEGQSQSAEIVQIGQSKTIEIQSGSTAGESAEPNKVVIDLRNQIIQLEGKILDLEETCKEKDSVIRSKTEAITLMSADLSKKGKDTLDLLDDTKEQMQKMQENFATMEDNMKSEKQALVSELEACSNKITYLEEANTILEAERFKLSVDNASLEEKIAAKDKEIVLLNDELQDSLKQIDELIRRQGTTVVERDNEEKGIVEVMDMEMLTKKIEALEEVNALLKESNVQLQDRISNTESQKSISDQLKEIEAVKIASASEENDYLASVIKSLESISNALNKRVLDVEVYLTDREAKIKAFRPTIESPDTEKSEDIDNEMVLSLPDKIKVLESLNYSLKRTNVELENKLNDASKTSPKTSKPTKRSGSKGKGGSKPKQPKNESESLWDNIHYLNKFIEILGDQIADREQRLDRIDDEMIQIIRERSKIEIVETVTAESTLESDLDNANKQIESLTKEMADLNKNTIKLKATHKTKVKELQKCIDDFSKVSDSNSEVIRLQGQVDTLTKKVTELEDDKGNLQLHLVDYDSDRVSDSQLHAKLLDIERIAEERLKAIADLEMQKFELVQDLHVEKRKVVELDDRLTDLSYLENEHVSSQIKSAELEEELESLKTEYNKISSDIEALTAEKNELLSNIEGLNKEKVELNTKLEMYIQENMDLIDRLDKLSAEKVSSAESIEMVESLTTQEKMEIEQYQKGFVSSPMAKDLDEKDDGVEKSELQAKIDLFSLERQEVIEKLEHYQSLNNTLNGKLEELLQEKKYLEEQYESVKEERNNLLEQAKSSNNEIAEFSTKLTAVLDENKSLQDKINQLNTEKVDEGSEKPGKADKKNTKEILRLKGVIKNKDAEINDLSSKVTELNEQLQHSDDFKKLYNEIDSHLNRIIALEEQIKAKDHLISVLETELSKFNDVLPTFELNVVKLTNIMAENNLELTEPQINLESCENTSDKINALLGDLHNKLDVINVCLINNKKNIVDIQNEQQINCNKVSQLEKECSNKDEKLRDVNRQLDEVNERLESSNRLVTDYEASIERLKRSDQSERLNELESELRAKSDILVGVETRLAELTKQYEDDSRAFDENKSNSSKMIDSINSLNRDKEALIVKLSSYEEQLSSIEKQSIAHLEQLQVKSEECENIRVALSKLGGLEEQIESKQIEINSLIEELETVRRNYREQQSAHEAKLQEREAFAESLETELKKEQDKSARNQQKLNKMELLEKKAVLLLNKLKERDATISEKAQRDNEQEKIITELGSQLKRIEDQLNDSRNENAHLSERNAYLDGTLRQMQGESDSLRSEIERLKQDITGYQSVESELATVTEQRARLESDYRAKLSEFDELQRKKMEDYEYLETLQTQCDDYVAQIRQFKEHCKNLQDDIETLTRKLNDYETVCGNLKMENDALTKQMTVKSQAEVVSSGEIDKLKADYDNLLSLLNGKEADVQKQIRLCAERDEEIVRLKNQFDSCFSQLTELVESEKSLQKYQQELTTTITQKDANINRLEEELYALKASINQQPVVEVVQAQISNVAQYFETPPKREVDLADLQAQIVCDDFFNQQGADNPLIRAFEHDVPKKVDKLQAAAGTRSDTPVDEAITPKSTYKCFDEDLKSKIAELESSVDRLNAEKSKLSNDLSQSQVKLNKALIKLKEFKVRHDNMSAELKKAKASSFGGLDSAIEDELYLQIRTLEDNLRELKTSTDKDKLEKEGLLKRIDVLTSANDQLITMKEKQDIELLMYINKSEKLTKKLELSQWDQGFEDFPDEEKPQSAPMSLKETDRLKEQIKVLEDDNNDLQNVVEKQKVDYQSLANKFEAFKAEKSDSDVFRAENMELKQQLEEALIGRNSVDAELNSVKERLVDNEGQLTKLNQVVDSKNSEISALNHNLEALNGEFTSLRIKYDERLSDNSVAELNAEIQRYESELNQLNEFKDRIARENESLRATIDAKCHEAAEFEKKFTQTVEVLNTFEVKVAAERNELEDRIAQLEQSKNVASYFAESQHFDNIELESTKQQLQLSITEKDHIRNTLEAQIANEIAHKNKLRDECLSLQAVVDSKCRETSEIEHQLRKTIEELATVESNFMTERNELSAKIVELEQSLESKNVASYFAESNQFDGVELEETRRQLQSAIADKDRVTSELQAQIAAEIADKVKLNDECESLRAAVDSKSREISDIERNLSGTVEDLRSERDVLSAKIAQMERDAETKNASSYFAESSQFDLIELENTKQQLQGAIVENDRIKQSFEVQVKEYEEKAAELTKLYEQGRSSITELENLLRSKDEDLQKYFNYEVMCNNKFNEINAVLNGKDCEISELKNQLNEYVQTVGVKDIELNDKNQELQYLYQKVADCDLMSQQIGEFDVKLADAIHEKDAELAQLRLTLHEERSLLEKTIADLNDKVTYLEKQLDAKFEECKALNLRLNETDTLSEQESGQMSEMRTALESQEIEIVTLKENLAASVQAFENLKQAHKAERHVMFAEDTKPGDDSQPPRSTEPAAPDLDLALYMLHQRDVRCEELTVELMRLLEERDTLQLKLSNALRTNEELRLSTPSTSQPVEVEQPVELPSPADPLQTKISELQSVNYARDVRLMDDSESRHRQMELLERDVQNLPPEAAAQLREAHYTLSRDTQSASTVIFNWLWGKTTPKVVHM